MDEYPKQALDKFRQWHFWWLVVFSFLLIITFVYYLPTRFLNQASQKPDHKGSKELPRMDASPRMTEPVHKDDHEEGETMMKNGEQDIHGRAVYHEEGQVKEGLAVNLNVNPVPYKVGIPLSIDFFVNRKPGNVPVLANQLELEHTKLMHVIGLRSDMNEFFHIHPEFLADNPSIFSVDHVFKKPGLYKIWSEIKKDGINHSFGHPEVDVNGAGSKEEKKVSFSRNVIAGPRSAEGSGEASQYQISLEISDTVVKGREVDLFFDIHSLTGMEIEVEQYLGADMHLSIIRDDRQQFIHTHPEGHGHSSSGIIPVAYAHAGTEDEPAGATDEHQTTPSIGSGQASGGDEVISFHVTLPEAGLYKAFAQFRPKGTNLPLDEALTAEFWVQVEEKTPFPISPWWFLLIVSVILIAGLSWWVNNYLKVKAEDIQVKK